MSTCNDTDVAFITLTNSEYIDYTINCLQSLQRIHSTLTLHIYCIGKEVYDTISNRGYKCSLIDQEENSNFQTFRNGNGGDITFHKFNIIYENLLKHDYVCFTDGDIVYENNLFYTYLLENIGDYDMLVQSEGDEIENYCTGFMFIKSNTNTLSIFNPTTVNYHKRNQDWDEVKNKLYYTPFHIEDAQRQLSNPFISAPRGGRLNEKWCKKLPLPLFPNGKYYYEHSNLSPYLIHFNWIVGHEKRQKMIQYGKWYENIKICQYGTDGFGHQFEGILRLVSLSLNNKADYQYHIRKNYTFAHNNVDKNKLEQYLFEGFNILSRINTRETIQSNDYQIIYNEYRDFHTIRKEDDYKQRIYFYDGIGCGSKLPNNFETKNEIKPSLPLLREAFIEKNSILPNPSYDNQYINVCCHIRLGDAVGTRILDNENLYRVVKYFQTDPKYRVIVHSDGNVEHLRANNTVIHGSNTDVLQILSDFVNADIFIITYSGLSIAAHLLAKESQTVICPDNAGVTFNHRILEKCITCNTFMHLYTI